jgi:mono/diheme cytochrome c family protein
MKFSRLTGATLRRRERTNAPNYGYAQMRGDRLVSKLAPEEYAGLRRPLPAPVMTRARSRTGQPGTKINRPWFWERAKRSIITLVSSATRFPRVHTPKPTAEPRWYSKNQNLPPRNLAIVEFRTEIASRRTPATVERRCAVDRIYAVITIIIAACLSVAVAITVAPQLRSVDLPRSEEANALVAQGRDVYHAACAGCHGFDLKGGAAHAAASQPPPLDASGHAWLHSDGSLFRMVKYGVADCPGKVSESRMPGFGDQLDDRSIYAVFAFIKSQWPPKIRIVQNAFNDGDSDAAEMQEAVLCRSICRSSSDSAKIDNGSR